MTKRISLVVSDELYDDLIDQAQEDDRSLNSLMITIVKAHFRERKDAQLADYHRNRDCGKRPTARQRAII